MRPVEFDRKGGEMTLFNRFIVALTLVASAGFAQAQVSVAVSGNVVTADIDINGVKCDVTITFDQAIGLNAQSIGLSASLVDVTDPALLSRLPATGMGIPAAFPLKLTIEPPDNLGLSFTGTATVEIHTHALTLVTNSPLRLLKAPLGGDFIDVTESLAAGSVRSRGRTGGFSEFVIGIDTRTHDAAAAVKFAALEAELGSPAIEESIRTELLGYFDTAQAAALNGDYLDAVAALDDFIDAVNGYQGQQIPNVWRASRDLDNVAGRMMAGARSIMFNLRMANTLL